MDDVRLHASFLCAVCDVVMGCGCIVQYRNTVLELIVSGSFYKDQVVGITPLKGEIP